MKFSDFRRRFYAAVDDFVESRPIKDELAAYAAASKHGLAVNQALPKKEVVHLVMLAGAYPELKVDALLEAYHHHVPWWTRALVTIKKWHQGLADPPEQLPEPRSHD